MNNFSEKYENLGKGSGVWKVVFYEQPEKPSEPHYPEVKSCVYCRANESVVEQRKEAYRVRCPVCKLTGPEMATAISSIHAWAFLSQHL